MTWERGWARLGVRTWLQEGISLGGIPPSARHHHIFVVIIWSMLAELIFREVYELIDLRKMKLSGGRGVRDCSWQERDTQRKLESTCHEKSYLLPNAA